MAGANYDAAVFHTAEKLAKSGQHVIFPKRFCSIGRGNGTKLTKNLFLRKDGLKIS